MPRGAREITLRFLAAPTDAGYSGTVGGGPVLEWIDKAGYAAAAGWSGTYCVTAYVGNVRFTRPVEVGDLVEATATIIHTGTSSVHILVAVSAGNPRQPYLVPTTECRVVFVAVGSDGRPTPVPALEAVTDEDRQRQRSAVRRIDLRAEIATAMAAQTYSHAGTAPRMVLRFLAAPTDVNWGGKVHGGIVMRWIDEAAHVLATGWTGDSRPWPSTPEACASTDHFASATSSRSRPGCCSPAPQACTSACTCAPVTPPTRELELATHFLIVFVTLDDDSQTLPAPSWQPVSAEDVALRDHALELVALRHQIDAERNAP